MEYLTRSELSRLFSVARRENELHWQMMLTAFYFGLRVSEVNAILGEDVQDKQLIVRLEEFPADLTADTRYQWPPRI